MAAPRWASLDRSCDQYGIKLRADHGGSNRSLRAHCGLPHVLHALADERLRPWRNWASHLSEHSLPPREATTQLIHELMEELAKLPPPPGPRLVASVQRPPAPVPLLPAPVPPSPALHVG